MRNTAYRRLDRKMSAALRRMQGGVFSQGADQVLIRSPLVGRYGKPEPAAKTAAGHWPYAVLSENAYQKGRAYGVAAPTGSGSPEADRDPPLADPYRVCLDPDSSDPIPIGGWRRWPDFPGDALTRKMRSVGLYVEVMERTDPPFEIAVVFEGTNFGELPDWKANLRWFLRFVPKYKDHYTVVARDIASAFHERITSTRERYRVVDAALYASDGSPIRIVSTGHSLGGGLAQHFAYTFKQMPVDGRGPKVSEVFAFDTSPVTGWFSAPDPPRSYNAEGLRINRIFEHGEVLAYLRLLTSRLALSRKNPEIWEYRYNFDSGSDMIANHSMRRLACGLMKTVGSDGK